MELYWGDIHNHNGVGYGKGALERSYRIARNSLDFYAFTPHGWWPDLPATDPVVSQRHLEGFELVRAAWPQILELANATNEDGAFTAFAAFEWHSQGWGDYHVLFPRGEGEVCRAATYDELMEFIHRHDCLAIPHHVAYRQGWRGANWETLDHDSHPVCEIYSEHGCTFEEPSHRGMFSHSMGGVSAAQTVLAQLQAGRVLGFTGGTDNHFGYPGSYGEGLTGVWADGLSRAQVMAALRNRHCYAVTGDRIGLSFHLGQAMMGDVVPAATPREFSLYAEALSELESVTLYKNGRLLACWHESGETSASGKALLRLEWGWDLLSSRETTTWAIHGRLEGGAVKRAHPCMGGGAGSIELVNLLELLGPTEFTIESFTSRQNPIPINAVVLDLEIDEVAAIELDITGAHPAGPFAVKHRVRLADLVGKDEWVAAFDSFSAPKLRLGPLLSKADLTLDASFVDPDPGASDFYYVKVLQKNGHMAWSSPIWCRDEPPTERG